MDDVARANRTIYVGNIAAWINEDAMVAFFTSCGAVTNVKLAGDTSHASRFGFVEFADPGSAVMALQLNGVMLGEKRLKVQQSKSPIAPGPAPVPHYGAALYGLSPMAPPPTAHTYGQLPGMPTADPYAVAHHHVHHPPAAYYGYAPRPPPMPSPSGGSSSYRDASRAMAEAALIPRTIYVSQIDKFLTEANLREFFGVCGTITECRLCGDMQHSTRFAFVEFETPEMARAAVHLNGIQLGSSPLSVAPSKNAILSSVAAKRTMETLPEQKREAVKRTIYVGSLDSSITEHELSDFFQTGAGQVTKVVLAGDRLHETRFGFVEFASEEIAVRSLALSGAWLRGRQIRVSLSKSPILVDGAQRARDIYYPGASTASATAAYTLPSTDVTSAAAAAAATINLAAAAARAASTPAVTSSSTAPGLTPDATASLPLSDAGKRTREHDAADEEEDADEPPLKRQTHE